MIVADEAVHWPDYPRALDELRRMVRAGGTLATFGHSDHVFVDDRAVTATSSRKCSKKTMQVKPSSVQAEFS
ncbi:MAG: hypothetical protein M1815_001674 [Lichina confinis]|nr:MAG: hypothetical protein M1815_001674 [Lichina confinis]